MTIKIMKTSNSALILVFVLANMLSACGGGSGFGALGSGNGQGGVNPIPPNPITTPNPGISDGSWAAGVFEPDSSFKNKCSVPRTTVNPITGNPYPDFQGSVSDEKNWLRSWHDDVYLWYDEVTDQDPGLFNSAAEYFPFLKTFATTASGKDKDEFHFTSPTDEFLQQQQSGITAGYGLTVSFVSGAIPREVLIAYTQPNSPATSAEVNLLRGTKLLEVDGVDLVNASTNADIDILNAGLFPATTGETHSFRVQDLGAAQSRVVTMTSAEITLQPVQNVKTFDTASGKVGYMLFNEHIGIAEQQLIDAVTQFESENIVDLVLDLRYNGGGFIFIASELASMLSDANTTRNKTFTKLQYNDKHPVLDPFFDQPITADPFYDESVIDGQQLPHLGLSRVFVLTGPGTCSASELIINGLRGIDLEVIQIGTTTCGKPYGFLPTDNCGTTYFTVNFKGVNDKGFGDYADGFSPEDSQQSAGVKIPGCTVADDFTHQLGDPLESRLAAALAYRTSGCPATSGKPIAGRPQDGNTIKPLWLQNAILKR